MTNKTKTASKAQLQQLLKEFAGNLEQLLALYNEIQDSHAVLTSLVEQADPIERELIAKRTEILTLAKELGVPRLVEQIEERDYDALMELKKKETIH